MSKIHIHNDNFGHFSLKWCFLGMSENLISQDKYINYDYIYIYIYLCLADAFIQSDLQCN